MLTFYQCQIWQDSETLWTYVIHHYPNRWLAYQNRGLHYGATGRYELAFRDHTKALTIYPILRYKAASYYARGLDYRHLADNALSEGREREAQRLYRLAEQDFDQVVGLGFARFDTYRQRGKVRYQWGDLSGAVNDLTVAIQRNAKNAEVLLDRGNAYAALGDYDRALQDLGRAIGLEPSSPVAYESRGVVFYRKEKTAEALADLNQALQLDPQYGQAFYDRSLVKFRQGDLAGARQDARHARGLGVTVAEEYFNKLTPPGR
jgi:tetratricopeptide (TPR) repeat protein